MRTRITFALLAAFTLAACSGGGGSSTTPGNLGNGNAGGNSTQSVTQVEAGTTGAEAGLDPVEQGDLENGVYSGSINLAQSGSRSILGTTPDGLCHNGVELTITVVSPTEKIYDEKHFYDKACTTLAREVVSDVVKNGAGYSVARVAKNFSANGALLSTRNTTFATTGVAGNFTSTIISSLTIGTSTSAAAQFGRTETVATSPGSNVSSLTGNSGHVVNDRNPNANESFGHQGQLVGVTETVDTSGNVTFAGEHDGTFFKGPVGTLSLSASAPFTVIGGTQYGTASQTGSVVFDSSGNLTAVNLTGTMLNGDTFAVTSAGSPLVVSGTIKDSGGNTIATFQVDQFGDGTITYANGTQALIMDWHVVK
jgi:hypothetical protein